MLIQVGDHEILLSDSTRLVDNMLAAGGQATLQVWPEMWHVFQFFHQANAGERAGNQGHRCLLTTTGVSLAVFQQMPDKQSRHIR